MATERLPNPHSPVEVRRSIGRLRRDTDTHTDEITAIEANIDAVEADVLVLDGRIDDLEDVLASYDGEAVEDVAQGMPVYGAAGLASVGLARADTVAKGRAAGLAVTSAATGFTCEYQASGRFELADWTAITGAATLTPSATYYLSAAGGLTTVAPTTVGHMLTEVGQAVEDTVLHLHIKRPVLL